MNEKTIDTGGRKKVGGAIKDEKWAKKERMNGREKKEEEEKKKKPRVTLSVLRDERKEEEEEEEEEEIDESEEWERWRSLLSLLHVQRHFSRTVQSIENLITCY